MRRLLIFSLALASVFCSSIPINYDEVPNFDMDQVLSPEDLQRLKELVAKERQLLGHNELRDVIINVILNDYVDQIMANVQTLILESGLDPTDIPDLSVDIGIGTTDLSEGQLNDTSTIMRYEDATLSYDNVSKRLVAAMVIRFEDLKFIYKYHTKVTFISITGHITGEVQHIHINLNLGFDFDGWRVFVDKLDFQHTGDINVRVSGNDAIDWITNAMSWAITGILHNVILDIIKGVIADPINQIVDSINSILHPSSLI